MYKGLLLCLFLLPLLLSGCVGCYASCAPARMGFFTNEELQVVKVLPVGPAQRAGLQDGDILIDVYLASKIEGLSNDPVSFTDLEAASAVMSYPVPSACCSGSLPVMLRVQRDGEIITLYMRGGYPRHFASDATPEVSPIATPTPRPTATPVPLDWLYF